MSASGSGDDADGADLPPPPARSTSRLGGARERVYATRDRVISSRDRYHQLDMALRTWERDVEAGGSLMAAALAFRLFLWTLPATVFLIGLLGFTVDDDQVEASGLRGYTVATVEQAATEAQHSRWLLVIVGGVLLVGVSYALTKTVVVATALIWGQPLRSVHRPVRAVGTMLASIILAFGLAALSSWLRTVSPGFGLTATIVIAALWALLWWFISYLLPHADGLPWWGLLPGALFIGVGTMILHLVTVYYFGVKLSSASELYGSLGTAATMLLWAYVVSRLVLASASINVAAVRTYGHPE